MMFINNMAEMEQTCVGQTADWLAKVKQPARLRSRLFPL